MLGMAAQRKLDLWYYCIYAGEVLDELVDVLAFIRTVLGLDLVGI
jgi:hypothetical protein